MHYYRTGEAANEFSSIDIVDVLAAIPGRGFLAESTGGYRRWYDLDGNGSAPLLGGPTGTVTRTAAAAGVDRILVVQAGGSGAGGIEAGDTKTYVEGALLSFDATSWQTSFRIDAVQHTAYVKTICP